MECRETNEARALPGGRASRVRLLIALSNGTGAIVAGGIARQAAARRRRAAADDHNYDSFTYNLVQYFGELGAEVRVFRNDEITVEGIGALRPDQLVLSPGPCSPAEAGVCVEAINAFTGKVPILGVCLGHQAIGAALGGKIVRRHAEHGSRSSSRPTIGRL